MSALEALQKAVFETLTADANLTALIGADRIFDDVPPATHPPYLVFADTQGADWSTGTEAGDELRFGIEIWSSQKGRKQSASIAQAIREALAVLAAIDPPYTLVNLRFVSARFERDPQTEYFRGLLRFRAVVEAE
jgi:hypothetical protein